MVRYNVMLLVGLISWWVIVGNRSGYTQEVTKEEIDALKKRLEVLESRLNTQDQEKSGSKLIDRVEISGSVVSVIQGGNNLDHVSMGSRKRVWDGTIKLDLSLKGKISDASFIQADLQAGNGVGIDQRVSLYATLNETAWDDDEVSLDTLFYEHDIADRITVRFGKLDLTQSCGKYGYAFDGNAIANDENRQFLSGFFVNNPVIEFPATNGIGLEAWWTLSDRVGLGIGIADGNGDWNDIFRQPFCIGQVDFRIPLEGEVATYRVYGWYNDTYHVDISNPSKTEEKGYGWGISFDQPLGKNIILFGRWGYARQSIYEMAYSWSAGVQWTGVLPHRNQDALGIAYGQLIWGHDKRDDLRSLGGNPENEERVEVYYRWVVFDQFGITPNFQWIKHLNGDGDLDPFWVAGIRLDWNF